MSKRHLIVVVDCETGLRRSASVHLPSLIGIAIVATSLPVLIGLGAKLSADSEITHLRAVHAALVEENASYRSATDAFKGQIQSLAGLIGELQPNGVRLRASASRPVANGTARIAIENEAPTPAMLSAVLPPSLATPDEIYDVLRGVLKVLSNRLPSIEQTVQRREALAAAAPSIWPAQGWLTAPFGVRSDPLTGEQGFHQGVDISMPQGCPSTPPPTASSKRHHTLATTATWWYLRTALASRPGTAT